MKKYIFIKAWELVKQKGMTISAALKYAWKVVKGSNEVADKVAEVVSKDQRYTLKDIAPELFAGFDFKTFHNGEATR